MKEGKNKKMRKTLVLTIVLLFSLCLVTACGKENDNNSNGTNDKINFKDNSIYYAIVDGKKYTMDDTIGDILDRGGYTISSQDNMNQMIDPTKKFDGTYLRKNDETYFSVQLGNRTNKSISKKECKVFVINLYSVWHKNVSIIGDLTIGSSKEEVMTVLGEGNYGLASTYGDNKRGFEFEYDTEGFVKNIKVFRFD